MTAPGKVGVRMLFIFDPLRRAVVLVGGDKAGTWNRWYPAAIQLAEKRYEEYLEGSGS